MLFISVVLPIFLIFLAGFLLQKKFELDIATLSKVSFYLLLPVLAFQSLYEVDIKGDLINIILFQLLLTIFLVIVIKIIVLIKRYPSDMESGIKLAVVFMNSGNYGAAFCLFAFGEAGFQLAITYWVIHVILMNSLGVYFANRHNTNTKQSLLASIRMPTIHAAAAGLLLQVFNLNIPEFLYKSVDFLAQAALPIIMIILGMQLASTKMTSHWGPISLGVTLRLIISPIIAAFIVLLILPVDGLLAKVLIIESAMPSAVIATLLASQYNSRPDVVSGVTLSSTIVSMGTLSVLLYLIFAFM